LFVRIFEFGIEVVVELGDLGLRPVGSPALNSKSQSGLKSTRKIPQISHYSSYRAGNGGVNLAESTW